MTNSINHQLKQSLLVLVMAVCILESFKNVNYASNIGITSSLRRRIDAILGKQYLSNLMAIILTQIALYSYSMKYMSYNHDKHVT